MPNLNVPPSKNTVRVRMINTSCALCIYALHFIDPVPSDHKLMNMTAVSFLIENSRTGQKSLWDLGIRKDYWNLPPVIRERIGGLCEGVKVDHDITDILTEKDVKLDTISEVIWSHVHWDHTGNVALFPPSTNLVYEKEIGELLPGYPENEKSPMNQTNFDNRKNVVLTFPKEGEDKYLNIGGYSALDFYGDGSFYLLKTPGHARGHICGLARTTEDTFIFMGGDICHFTGVFRPNKTHPFPETIPQPILDATGDANLSATTDFLSRHPQFTDGQKKDGDRRTTPFYAIPTHSKSAYDYPGPQVAQETVTLLRDNFDEDPNVLIALAHDPALLEFLPSFNDEPDKDVNDWKARGLKEKYYWGWLKEIVRSRKGDWDCHGFYRDGKRYDSAKEMLAVGDK